MLPLGRPGSTQQQVQPRHRGRMLAQGRRAGRRAAGGLGCTGGRTSPGLFGLQGAFTPRLFFHPWKTGVAGVGSGSKHREPFRGARVSARGSPGTRSGH